MLVYGDRERIESVADVLARLSARHAELRATRGPTRHAQLVALGIECGMFVQALLDRERARHACDERTPLADAGAALCLTVGRALATPEAEDAIAHALAWLRAEADDGTLTLREPEGYAFYALYPELVLAAARALAPTPDDTQVIGIRSIGTSLAGFVAGALGTTRLPYSLRPVGHPFARTVQVGPALGAALCAGSRATRYVIVDEGPGLSGSSFVAVAEWLATRGVPESRIVVLPSHGGEPGPASRPEVRACYARLAREHVPFEQVFDEARLRGWFAHVTGPLSEAPGDVSGGRWRAFHYARVPARMLPPSHVRDERRKYVLRSGERAWLMKYCGLGEGARRLLTRARTLSAHGFTPALIADHHGFFLSPLHEDATPLPLARGERGALIAQLARYLSFLAERFVDHGPGAEPDALLTMLRHNASVLLGSERCEALARLDALLPALRTSQRRVAGDHKLDAHEWLLQQDGTWLKCDAEAHHAGHDLIGCQDPAWDLAGARIELSLSDAEHDALLRTLCDRVGLRFSPDKLAFYELSYAAFRAGHAHFAELALAGWAEDDAARFRAEKARYAAHVAERLPG